MIDIEKHEIVQIDPSVETFGACMVVVTEVKKWGIQGYVQSAGIDGQQYVRISFDKIAKTGGKAEWVIHD